jgi:hypothetical protein
MIHKMHEMVINGLKSYLVGYPSLLTLSQKAKGPERVTIFRLMSNCYEHRGLPQDSYKCTKTSL